MKVQQIVAVCLITFALLGVTASASGQSIGAPQVTVLPDNSVVLTYFAPGTPPTGTTLVATYNGVALAPIPIGSATTLQTSGPIAAGTYTVQIVWGPGVASEVVTFVVSPAGGGLTPATPLMHAPIVTGNSVFLSWDPVSDATLYEVEALIFASGQRVSMAVATTSLTVPNVPAGNYGLRVRAGNAFGASGFSNQVLASVATTFRLRDMEATVTWNTEADIDLHVIEPNGNHVWWKNRNGTTVRLDTDRTTGFGPETASIDIGGAVPGIYQVFLVHYRGDVPTVSNLAITIGVGTANPLTRVITRMTEKGSPTTGINAALVDVRSGVIGEAFGTRETAAALEAPTVRKP